MFEAGPTLCPSSRPDVSRSLARQRVAPPSTPRKNRAVAKEPPKNFLTPLDKWYVICLKQIQEVSTTGIYNANAAELGDGRGKAARRRRRPVDRRGLLRGRDACILPASDRVRCCRP